METVYHHFARSAVQFADRIAVEVTRRTGLESVTYGELQARVDRAAMTLAAQGVQAGARCAILADNDADWCACYLATLRLGATAVPLDTAYRAEQVRTVVADCGAAAVFTSLEYLPVAQAAVQGLAEPPHLVLMAERRDGVITVGDVGAAGHQPLGPCPATPDHVALLLYTSGTTSDPKGVMLTHRAMLAERNAAFRVVNVTETDALLGVLPLFHALAQVANLLAPLTVGARVVFMETVSSGELVRVLAERGITIFVVVPQFFYLIHQRVMEKLAAAPWVARASFKALLSINRTARRRLGLNLGRLFFGRVHDAVGRAMRVLVTGGSRFDPRIGRDLFDMGFNIIQAYGLTECAGACTAARPGDPCIESVGQPLDGVEIRIAPEPGGSDREYPDGEVLVRGPIVMLGYYNRPEATAAALQDGWLLTGDLGYLDDQGRLFITGRKKEMIVLASGKNIYPEEIEAVYAQSPFIKELCVLGVSNPDEPSAERLHAVVVPNLDTMQERRVVNMREVIRFDIEGLSLQLPHHKRVLSFDVSQDDLPRTSTRKLKRHAIEQAYYARAVASTGEQAPAELTDDDRAWMDDPFVGRVLPLVQAAAKPGRRVAPGAHLELDLGLDSMERVELLTSIEHTFGITIPDDDAHRIFTVRDLVDTTRASATPDAGVNGPVDPWNSVLAPDAVVDADLAYLLRRRPLYTPLAFVLLRTWAAVMRLSWGLRVTGRAEAAAPGAFLICPNHQSYLDAFLLVATLPYRTFARAFFVGAAEYFKTPTMVAFARLINLVPVDPDAHLMHAMQAGAFGLRHGKVLVLFPEGERSPDGSVRTFKKGAAILATHLQVPIVPVALRGIYELWPRGAGFRWPSLVPFSGARASVAYGRPVPPPSPDGAEPSGDTYTRHIAAVREAIVAMWTALPGRP